MRCLSLFIGLIAAGLACTAVAQSPGAQPLRLEAGTVFEVMAPEMPAVQTPSWSLSQDKTFLQASRSRVFRTRFISPGTYTLQLEYGRLPDVESHTLRILVEAPAAGTQADSARGQSISATKPPRDAYGRVVLQNGTGIVGLYPYQTLSGSMLSLDTNQTQDADGDGDAQNDNVVAGTYFSVRGTPLFLWYFAPAGKRVITVESVGKARTVIPVVDEKTALEEESSGELKPVESEELPPLEGMPPPPTQPVVPDEIPVLQGNGEVFAETLTGTLLRFSLQSDELAGQAVLLRWTFGDGTESLLDAPVHRYARAGTYTVQVTATDLRTARVIGMETIIVEASAPVNGGNEVPPENGSSSSVATSQQAKPSGGGWLASISSFFGIIWKYFFWFILSALLAIVARFVFGLTKRMGSIPDLVAKVEKSFTEPGVTKAPDIAEIMATPAAPLALNVVETTVEDVPTVEEEEPPAPLPANDAATPDWLKDGLELAAAAGQTPDNPPPPVLNIAVQETAPLETVTPALPPEPWSAPTASVQPAPPVEQVRMAVEPTTPLPPAEMPSAPAPAPIVPDEAPAPDWLTAPLPTLDDAQPAVTIVATQPPAEPVTEATSVTATVVPDQPEAPKEDLPITEAKQTAEEDDVEMENPAGESKAWTDMTPEEREREKKRQKRKRYRQNKKLREKGTAATPATAAATTETAPEKTKESEAEKHDDEDGPTFVIRADSIS